MIERGKIIRIEYATFLAKSIFGQEKRMVFFWSGAFYVFYRILLLLDKA